jgi:Tfp pilus assembly protein PilF
MGEVGPRTDLYSLSVVLYRMVTGRLPFEGPAMTVLYGIMHEPSQPSAHRPDLDPALETIIRKGMALRPEERYPTAHALIAALDGWLGTDRRETPKVAEDAPPNPARKAAASPTPRDRRRWRMFGRRGVAVLAITLTVLIGAGLLKTVLSNRDEHAIEHAPASARATEEQLREACRRAAEAEREYREACSQFEPRDETVLKAMLARAELYYRDAIRLNPDLPELHYKHGNLLTNQGQAAKAEKEYREALRIKPDFPEAHYNLGNVLRRQGKLEEAEKEFREAIRIKPHFPDAHYNLGVLLHEQGKVAEAEAEYDMVLRLKPDYAEALANLGLRLRDQGRFHEALAELRRGHELGSRDPRWPHPSAAWGQDCQRLAELDALLPAVLAGVAEPADAGAALGFARVCRYTKRHAAAARLWAAVMDAAPGPANDPRNSIRYTAACSAALAGCGQGIDAPADEAGRARLRDQARAWLVVELMPHLDSLSKVSASKDLKAVQAVRHCKEDPDLAGVRDADALDRLPAEEREHWRTLWAVVDAALRKAAPEK